MLLCGFAGAFMLQPLVIGMPRLITHPLTLLHRQQSLWSFGALGGGLVAAMLFCLASRYSGRQTLALLDTIAFTAPFGAVVARLGCALAHDHRGFRTASWIAVNFPGGARSSVQAHVFAARVFAGRQENLGHRPQEDGCVLTDYLSPQKGSHAVDAGLTKTSDPAVNQKYIDN
jgi:hypothetical protein